jgi:putative SOS response-associated peptidase YedK
MCGRYTLTRHPRRVAELFGLESLPELEPRYNIAPGQRVPVVRDAETGRQLVLMKWGLVPAWAAEPGIGNRLLNARCETVADKPAYRAAYRKRRCLLPADGFYEWKTVQGRKQPFLFRLRDGDLFALAGLWESWHTPDGATLETCTVLTTAANELIRPLHDRMPVVIRAEDHRAWLHPEEQPPDSDRRLFTPFPADAMEAAAVNPWVNRAGNEGPRCLEPPGQGVLFGA